MATILFLAHRIPYPPDKGDKLRAFQVLNHWAKHHRVFLGCFIDSPEDLKHRDLLRKRCAGTYFARLNRQRAAARALTSFVTQGPMCVRYYHDRGLAAWISHIMASERPERVFVFSSVMGQFVVEASKSSRVLVDFVDVDSEKWAAYAATKKFPARQIYRREARELLRFDRRLAARADANIFVSEPEAALFRSRAPEADKKIFAIANGINFDLFLAEQCWFKTKLYDHADYCFHRANGLLAECRRGGVVQRHRSASLAREISRYQLLHRGRTSLSQGPGAQLATRYCSGRSSARHSALCRAC